MFHLLEEVKLVVDHLLVALDVLLEDDLDCDLASRALGLADDTIGTGTKRASEMVFCPGERKQSVSACFGRWLVGI